MWKGWRMAAERQSFIVSKPPIYGWRRCLPIVVAVCANHPRPIRNRFPRSFHSLLWKLPVKGRLMDVMCIYIYMKHRILAGFMDDDLQMANFHCKLLNYQTLAATRGKCHHWGAELGFILTGPSTLTCQARPPLRFRQIRPLKLEKGDQTHVWWSIIL